MTSTRNPLQDFILTPQQQTLLFAALNSNRPGGSNAAANGAVNMSPSSFGGSPDQANGVEESPFQDYDYDFGGADSSFDFSFDNANQKMIGDLPGGDSSSRSDTSDHESPDKRSHDDDDDDDENEPKRRESEEKVAKKPGRKPLTTEPSSKRKAQNRAAQRAFRERKEKHLKDLETKVQELEKASESTSKENEQLKAKVDKMTVELNEYKKRFTAISTNRSTPSTYSSKPFGHAVINNLNDVNFQFEFPKFGALPGPPASRNDPAKRSSSASSSALKRINSDQMSPMERPKDGPSPSNSSSYSQVGLDQQTKEDLASFSAGLFNSPIATSNAASTSRTSFDSHYSNGGGTTTSSPSASSNSNMGGSSSCGTSPEPYTQSPLGFKPVDQLSTIGEENSAMAGTDQGFSQFGNLDFNNNGGDLSWLSNQQDFQFDPQLFGNYRESQASVLSTGGLDDSFFNDAFDADFVTPYNMPMANKQLKSPEMPKKDLIAQIDAAKEDGNDVVGPNGELLTCNKIWEQLQACPKVQNGDFDLDGLCSDLQKKAKCSGHGAVVDEKDFKNVMEKYLGKKDGEACAIAAKAS